MVTRPAGFIKQWIRSLKHKIARLEGRGYSMERPKRDLYYCERTGDLKRLYALNSELATYELLTRAKSFRDIITWDNRAGYPFDIIHECSDTVFEVWTPQNIAPQRELFFMVKNVIEAIPLGVWASCLVSPIKGLSIKQKRLRSKAVKRFAEIVVDIEPYQKLVANCIMQGVARRHARFIKHGVEGVLVVDVLSLYVANPRTLAQELQRRLDTEGGKYKHLKGILLEVGIPSRAKLETVRKFIVLPNPHSPNPISFEDFNKTSLRTPPNIPQLVSIPITLSFKRADTVQRVFSVERGVVFIDEHERIPSLIFGKKGVTPVITGFMEMPTSLRWVDFLIYGEGIRRRRRIYI